MSLFSNFGAPLKAAVGNNYDNQEQDIIQTKRHLNKLGYFEDNTENPIITVPMNDGLKQLQKDNGLKIDGIMKPGGETERLMFEQLENKPATTMWDYNIDDTAQIGFGGLTSGTLPALDLPTLHDTLIQPVKQKAKKYPDDVMGYPLEEKPEPTQSERILQGLEDVKDIIDTIQGNGKQSKENRGAFKTTQILQQANEECLKRMSLMEEEVEQTPVMEQDDDSEDKNVATKEKTSTEKEVWSYEKKISELDFDPAGKGMLSTVLRSPVDSAKARKAAIEAKEEANARFPNYKRRGDNQVDAYRHALWSIKLTRRLGAEKAKEITDAYERYRPNQSRESQVMDLENNKIVRELALDPKNKDKGDVELADEALDNRLLVVKPHKKSSDDIHDPFHGRRGLTETQNKYSER